MQVESSLRQRPSILVVSHVSTFRLRTGQDLRVAYMLKGLSEVFDVTFLTLSNEDEIDEVRELLSTRVAEALVLPPRLGSSRIARLLCRFLGEVYGIATGLKVSNFVIGHLDLSPSRLSPIIRGRRFDCLLTEYWHAHKITKLFPYTPCVLDMHDILWKARAARLDESRFRYLSSLIIPRYRRHEETAWRDYQALVAINDEERSYVEHLLGPEGKVFYVPMGVDLSAFIPRTSLPSKKVVAYYGGLGSSHNAASAIQGAREIMPRVWNKHPDAEYWMIGGSPTEELRKLAETDMRFKLTGFVENLSSTLGQVSVLVCPWHGTHGFRSRLIEVMAVGVPVVATFDAVYGMRLEADQGLRLAETASEMADHVIDWLSSPEDLAEQGARARQQVQAKLSYENTYLCFAQDLHTWLGVNGTLQGGVGRMYAG